MARSVFAFLLATIAIVGASCRASTLEDYWHTVLPTTPIPSSLRQLFPTGGKAAVDSNFAGVGVTVGPPGVGVIVGPPGGVYVNFLPFVYQYAASETQVRDNADVALFFLEKDLVPGSTMNLHFTKTVSRVPFLSRSVADSLPFSSSKLGYILRRLSVKPNSQKAAVISETLHACEEPAARGETKYCATSLESMVDFATASLGSRDLLALSTEVSKPNSPKQAYAITRSAIKKLAGGKAVACHDQPYAYAVYFCHATRGTKSYAVSLVGEDGTRVEAVVVCHTDTSSWNPKHIAFQLLKVSPGTVPVCHFLPQDHVVWTRRA